MKVYPDIACLSSAILPPALAYLTKLSFTAPYDNDKLAVPFKYQKIFLMASQCMRLGVLGELRNGLNCKKNVRASAERGIHEGANSFKIRDVAHLGKFEGGGWSLGCGEPGAGFHGC